MISALKLPRLNEVLIFFVVEVTKITKARFSRIKIIIIPRENCLNFSENEFVLVGQFLVLTFFDDFNFWASLFCKNGPNFCHSPISKNSTNRSSLKLSILFCHFHDFNFEIRKCLMHGSYPEIALMIVRIENSKTWLFFTVCTAGEVHIVVRLKARKGKTTREFVG